MNANEGGKIFDQRPFLDFCAHSKIVFWLALRTVCTLPLQINWYINLYISFIYRNLHILIHIFSYIPLFLAIQHEYLKIIRIGVKRLVQQWKKSQVRKREIPPWAPGKKESPQKTHKILRYSLNIDVIQICLYDNAIQKSGLYNFSGEAL
jgi:hypothetical protein